MLVEIFRSSVVEALSFVLFVGGLGLLCYGFDKFIDWSQKFDLW